MRKKINILIIILMMIIPLLFININASQKELVEYIEESNVDLAIDNYKDFNRIHIIKNKLDGFINKMVEFPQKYNLGNEILNFGIGIGNDTFINIKYYINDNYGDKIEYSINNDIFLSINKTGDIQTKDLYLDGVFQLNNDKSLFLELNDIDINLFNVYDDFYNDLGLNYIYVYNIKEKTYNESYFIGDAPDNNKLNEKHFVQSDDYSFILGEYDNNIVGNYNFDFYIISSNGCVYINHYNLSILEQDHIYCDEIIIDYNSPISTDEYLNNYVHHNDNITNNMIIINSNYFTDSKILPGIYKVNISVINKDLVCEGIINVIDGTCPIINGDRIRTGYVSMKKTIKEIFNDVKVIDEIDGDITNNLMINDLNNYENNMDKPGEYLFDLRVYDNNRNMASELFKYILKMDEPKTSDDDNIIPSTNNSTINTNPTNIIPSTYNSTNNINPTTNVSSTNNSFTNIGSTTNPTNINRSSIITSSIIKSSTNNEKEIEYSFRTTTTSKMTENDIKKKLIFYGFVEDDFDGIITSDYFGSEDIPGEYQIIAVDNDNIKHYYSLFVEKGSNEEIKKEENNSTPVIIISVICGVVVVLIGAIIFVLRKKKLNK